MPTEALETLVLKEVKLKNISMKNPRFLSESPVYFDEERDIENENMKSLSLSKFQEKYTKAELITLREFAETKKMKIINVEKSNEWKKLIEDLRNFR